MARPGRVTDIADAQQGAREIGRIRFGEKRVSAKSGKEYPAALDSPRLTSPSEEAIRGVAALYGGEARPWESPSGAQWEVTVDRRVAVVVPPGLDEVWSRAYEVWSRGGCQRRCDGVRAWVPQGRKWAERPCLCGGPEVDPEERECKMHLRFRVMVLGVPVLGLWRAETQGFYAGTEIPPMLDMLQASGRAGWLRLEPRQRVSFGETRNFPVVVIDAPFMPEEVLQLERPPGMEELAPPPVRPQLASGTPAGDAGEASARTRYAELKALLPAGTTAVDFFEGHGITRASMLVDDAVYDRAREAVEALRAAAAAVDDGEDVEGEVVPEGGQESLLGADGAGAYHHPEAP